jgi:hypothetical protein
MAAGDSQRCIRNAPFRAIFAIRDTSGALVIGATSLDSEAIRDSSSPADLTNEAAEIGSSGIYSVDVTAAEMTVTGDVSLLVKSSQGVPTFQQLPLEPSLESGVAVAATVTSLTLRSGASSTNDLYNGAQVEIVRGTGQGQTRTIVDYVGATKIVTIDRAWITNPDSTSVYQIQRTGARMGLDAMIQVDIQQVDGNSTAAESMAFAWNKGLITSSVDDSTPTSSSFAGASGLSTSNDFYNNGILIFTSGTLAGIAREITDYVGSTLTFTTSAFPVSPANGDSFMIIGRVF